MAAETRGGIAILGAGAIGSFVGARLHAAGEPVWLIGRPEAMIAVRERGLTLLQPGRRPVLARDIQAVSSWEEILPAERANVDLVILTTKAHDTEAAVAGLDSYLPESVPLLILQNGVGGADLARAQSPRRPLLAGVITIAVTRPGPGLVRSHNRRGGVGLAAVNAPVPTLHRAAGYLAAAGFPTYLYADYRAMAWSKLLLNMLGNAVPAIVQLPPERVFKDLALCRLEIAAFREALAVTQALGLRLPDLPAYPVRSLAWAMQRLPVPILHRLLPTLVGGGRGGKRPSLQIDLELGRRESEVEYLNGAVVRAARELGVAAPANALIHRTLSAMVQGTIPRDAYAANPHSLLAPLR